MRNHIAPSHARVTTGGVALKSERAISSSFRSSWVRGPRLESTDPGEGDPRPSGTSESGTLTMRPNYQLALRPVINAATVRHAFPVAGAGAGLLLADALGRPDLRLPFAVLGLAAGLYAESRYVAGRQEQPLRWS